MREPATIEPDLHVPLQVGRRRRPALESGGDTRCAPTSPGCARADRLNVTSDVRRRFAHGGRHSVRASLGTVSRRMAGPRSLRARRWPRRAATAASDSRAAVGQEGARAEARKPRAEHASSTGGPRSGARTLACSWTGAGRGYGDELSPWLVDCRQLGELGVPVRGHAVTEEGILAAWRLLLCRLVHKGPHIRGAREPWRWRTSREARRPPARPAGAASRDVPRRSAAAAGESRTDAATSSPRTARGTSLENYSDHRRHRRRGRTGTAASTSGWHVLGGKLRGLLQFEPRRADRGRATGRHTGGGCGAS